MIYIARGSLKNIFASRTMIVTALFSSIKNHCYRDKRSAICRFRMHSFSSNAIFHAYDDNLKMRRNLSAEKIQIGVTELPDQVRQTHFQSVTTKLVYFPKHALQSPAATRENDRTLAATEYRAKPAQKYTFCGLN